MTLVNTFKGLLKRLATAREGGVAMLYAIALPVVLMMSVAGVDLHRASTVRMNLQDALDAAALAAARSPDADTTAKVQAIGMAALRANLYSYPHVALNESLTSFTLADNDTVVATAKVDVDALVANVVLPPYGKLSDDTLRVGASSEVKRSSTDLEVALVLDITGSMDGTRLTDLKTASKDLVDLVVKPNQTLNKTRMSLVPYSMGVNIGSTYADAVRGSLRGTTSISGASWVYPSSSNKTITGVTRNSPGVVTSSNHGFKTDDYVWITGVLGMTKLNDKAYRVVRINNNTFSLQTTSNGGSSWSNVNTTNSLGYLLYVSGGTARPCQTYACEVVVTSSNHGMNTGEQVRIRGVGGMSGINNTTSISGSNLYHTVTRIDASSFALDGVVGPLQGSYSSGGTVQCLEVGCQSYQFVNDDGNDRVFWSTTCVTERTGANAYTDTGYSSAYVGAHYTGYDAAASGGCLDTTITPLTSDKDALKAAINGYVAEGATSGHIGTAWGWYTLAPNFQNLWPSASRPDPYGTHGLQKIMILMTDGEFNAVYCNGVRAKDSGSGGGSSDRKINCNSPNGSPFAQAVALCTAAKAKGIIIYTVGFDISSGSDNTPNVVDTAREVMAKCATDSSKVYYPENGSALKQSFAAIGKAISELRISR